MGQTINNNGNILSEMLPRMNMERNGEEKINAFNPITDIKYILPFFEASILFVY
jgi:hypothetical protein